MPLTPEMEKDVKAMRERVRTILHEAQARSQKSGKPLLIIAGEDHSSTDCAVLEMIIYQEARALGVKDVALESDSNLGWLKPIPFQRLYADPGFWNYRQAQFFQAHLHGVDGAKVADDTSPRRDGMMVANLLNIHRPVFMPVGAAHLYRMQGNPALRKQFELVNLDCTNEADNFGQTWSNNHHDGWSLQLSGGVNDYASLTLEELAHCGLGSKEGPAFLKWAEKHAGKPSVTHSMVAATALLKDLKQHPHDIKLHFDRAMALYETGHDEEAAKEMATAMIEGLKQNKGDFYVAGSHDGMSNINFGGKGIAPSFPPYITSSDAYEKIVNDKLLTYLLQKEQEEKTPRKPGNLLSLLADEFAAKSAEQMEILKAQMKELPSTPIILRTDHTHIAHPLPQKPSPKHTQR